MLLAQDDHHDERRGYGGEEFLLMLPGCDLPVALRRANDFRQAVSREPILASGHARHVTVSMGVNATSATMNMSATILLSETDAALYRAKEQGREWARGGLRRPLIFIMQVVRAARENS